MRKFLPKALFLSLAAFLVFTFVARQVFASTVVNTANPNGWAFQVQSPDGSGTFVSGPAGQPLGAGSARLFTGTNGNMYTALHSVGFNALELSAVTNINYSTYSSSVAPSGKYPRLIIDVETDFGTDELIFDPETQTQTPVLNTWQDWDADAGNWRSTLFENNFSGGTLSQYIAFVQNGSSIHRIINRGDGTGGLRLQMGPASSSDIFDGNVDNFTINTGLGDTTYDFEPDVLGVTAPTVTTTAATSIDTTLGTLNGTANPNGDTATGWFRYRSTDPGATPCTDDDVFGTKTVISTLGAGSSDVLYNQSITGLSPTTTYYYCAIAGNGGGTSLGSVLSFTTLTPPPTPPTVTTSAAGAITTTTATLNGSANPNGDATTGWFRYATVDPGTCSDTFGTRAPLVGGTSLGSGSTATAYNQPITGLTAGGTYYFCAIAGNGGGTGLGSVLSFTTTNPDVTPPSTPTNLVGRVLNSWVQLTWNVSTDNVGVAGYKVMRALNGNPGSNTQVGNITSGTSFLDTTVAAGTNYNYTVIAYDAALNNSLPSNSVLAKIPVSACYDVTGDGAVSLSDVGRVLSHVGEVGQNIIWDLNHNGAVSLQDVGMVLRQVGKRCTYAP